MEWIKQLLKRIRKGEQSISMRFFLCFVSVVIGIVGIIFLLIPPKEEKTSQTLPWQQSIHTISSTIGSVQTSATAQMSSLESKIVVVDIKGEVNSPGVYELKENDRIQQAIEVAGGFTDKADQALINLAQRVSDQMMIVVPTKNADGTVNENGGGVIAPIVTQTATDLSQSKLVNVNTATVDELMTLSGIGQKKAEQIIAYRDEHGSFKTVEELTNVPGFGERTVERLKSEITVQ